MGTSRLTITVERAGPLFDGRAEMALQDFIRGVVTDVSKVADDMLHSEFRRFKHPTGHFASQLTRVATGPYQQILPDPVIYGPWLEGTSRRNESTRFKGYHMFRRAAQRTRRYLKPFLQKQLDTYIRAMN